MQRFVLKLLKLNGFRLLKLLYRSEINLALKLLRITVYSKMYFRTINSNIIYLGQIGAECLTKDNVNFLSKLHLRNVPCGSI